MRPQIEDLEKDDATRIDQVAQILFRCFQKYAPDWLPDVAACRAEVVESFLVGRRSRVLIDNEGDVLGWIGAITDKNVWEIHPIAVAPEAQRRGYGAMLVNDIANLAQVEGAVALWAGTSDETGVTSFSEIDLYSSPSAALTSFSAPSDHPIYFWLKAGFSLVGVRPDEEGLGKPGIHFAKRIQR